MTKWGDNILHNVVAQTTTFDEVSTIKQYSIVNHT